MGGEPCLPACESLSQTDPAKCPRVQGGSGAYVNTDLTCVYNPGCKNGSASLGCFEQTGCQYKSAALSAPAPQCVQGPDSQCGPGASCCPGTSCAFKGEPCLPTCESLSQTDPARCPRVQGGSGAYINTDLTCVYNPGCITGAVSHKCFEQTGCQYKSAPTPARLAANTTGCGQVGLYMTGTEWTQVCQRMCPGSQSTAIGHGGNCWQCWCHGQGVQPPTALPDPGYEDLVSGAFPGCCASNTYPQSEKDPCGSWQLKEKGQC